VLQPPPLTPRGPDGTGGLSMGCPPEPHKGLDGHLPCRDSR
jgi:hypothetical protein